VKALFRNAKFRWSDKRKAISYSGVIFETHLMRAQTKSISARLYYYIDVGDLCAAVFLSAGDVLHVRKTTLRASHHKNHPLSKWKNKHIYII
jgi:hypothetical protein